MRSLRVVVAALFFATPAFANRLAGGSLDWVRDTSFVSSTQARFNVNVQLSLRRSFAWTPAGANPPIGGVINDFVLRLNNGATTQALSLNVQSIDVAGDRVIAGGTAQVLVPLTNSFTPIDVSDCCRVTALLDGNANQNFALRSVLTLAGSRSPRATGVLRVYMTRNQTNYLTIPMVAPSGTTVAATIASTSASGLLVAAPTGLTLDSALGRIQWAPTVAGDFGLQVTLTASDGTLTPFDFVITVNPNPPAEVTMGLTCGSIVPTPIGNEGTILITAQSNRVGGDTITLLNTPLSTGMTITTLATNADAGWVVTWSPGRPIVTDTGPTNPSSGSVACFQAQGLSTTSFGQCCVTFEVQQTNTRLVSGMLRDFRATQLDFGSANGDDVPVLVQDQLGADLKPVLRSGSFTTISSAASFNAWWSDSPDAGAVTQRAINFMLGNSSPDAGTKRFASSHFYPVDQLPGSPEPNPNRYFTWELHDVMPWTPGATLSFASSDDLWVFWNGRLLADLGGVHARQALSVSLDAFASAAGMQQGQRYPLDLFYAHRGGHEPELLFELVNDPPACTLPTRSPQLSQQTLLGVARSAGPGLVLQARGDGGIDGGATRGPGGFFLTERVDMTQDFQLDFDVVLTNNSLMDGFAFVLADAPGISNAWLPDGGGVVAGTLGYSGIPNSLAVEFDTRADVPGDLPTDHIAVMTQLTQPNTVSHQIAQRGFAGLQAERYCEWPWWSSCVGNLTQYLFTRHVRVTWNHAFARSGPTRGWLRVWLERGGRGIYVPDFEAELSESELASLFTRGALLGITTSHSPGLPDTRIDFTVNNLSIRSSVPATSSAVVSTPASRILGQTVTVRFATRDACGTPMRVGSFATSFLVTASDGAGATAIPTITDLGDGTYDVTYTPTSAGTWSLALSVRALGAISGSPAVTNITASCRDGFVQGTEQCDDGNSVDDDGCTNSCTLPRCGDTIVQTGEQCDDGNTLNTDACTNGCAFARCGDNFVQPPETCDDANAIDNDGCTNACTLPRCGDSIVQSGEQCDDGNSVNADACTNACNLARCGDTIVQGGEGCDDGNMVDDDGCTNLCRLPTCGDMLVQSGEACDDGNMVNDDACTNGCTLPRCGDTIVQSGEQCDDGNAVDTDACSNACVAARCGDTVVQNGEGCDDGNTVNDDACTNACALPRCGDTVVQSGEACDDGNTVNDDACSNACNLARCGDTIVQSGETCDDGNTAAGDGCSATCIAEATTGGGGGSATGGGNAAGGGGGSMATGGGAGGGGSDVRPGCGCSSLDAGVLWLALGLLGFRRRRA